MSDWQPIETAPKDGSPFLCRWKPPEGKAETIIAMWCDGAWPHGFHGVNVSDAFGHGMISSLTFGFDGGKLYATHWMPLPDPPHPKEGGER